MSEAPEAQSPATVRVVFMPSGRRGAFPAGTPVLTAARSLGVDIDSVCGGRAICGRCQISLSTGEFAKLGIESRETHLRGTTEAEKKYDRIKGLADGAAPELPSGGARRRRHRRAGRQPDPPPDGAQGGQ